MTVPGPRVWTTEGIGLVLLLVLSWLLNLAGIAPWHPDFAFLFGIGTIAALGTSIGEEALFRGVLLRPSPDGKAAVAPAAASALVFALWHPVQAVLYDPLWEPYAWRWWFLAGTGLLGFACAILTQSTRSLWPAVILHMLVALGWKTLYGIPSCGLAPCAAPSFG